MALTKRTIALGVAITMAGFATVALLTYFRGVEKRAFDGIKTVQAFVAKELIPAGTSADTAIGRGLIVRQALPQIAMAEGALKSTTQIKGKVAAVHIYKGEQIIATRFQAAGAIKGRLSIPQDRQALSVEVAIPPGVSGYIQAGDRVSAVAQVTVPKPGSPANAQVSEPRVQYLLQDIEVLAVGQRIVTTPGQKEGDAARQQQQVQAKVLLTLALSPVEVEKLAYAIFQGQVYFTLLPSGQKPVGTPGRTAADLFS